MREQERLTREVGKSVARLRMVAWVLLAVGILSACVQIYLADAATRNAQIAATPLLFLPYLGGFVVLRAIAPALDLLGEIAKRLGPPS